MSLGYADRLKEYPHKGVCGLPEKQDTERQLQLSLRTLVDLVSSAEHLVVLTGAGISTAAGIPDFRGPDGIWTTQNALERAAAGKPKAGAKRKRKPKAGAAAGSGAAESGAAAPPAETRSGAIDFASASPTLTHHALAELARLGKLKYVVTQNVDALHQRSGLPRSKLAVLHGCIFEERCEACGALYLRETDVGTISFQPTGRYCTRVGEAAGSAACGGVLRDTLLDWEDPLPEAELTEAERHCERADLILALGTSLRIEPAGSLPCRHRRGGGYVIVNLQRTPKDSKAKLIVRAPVDRVMAALMREVMGLELERGAAGARWVATGTGGAATGGAMPEASSLTAGAGGAPASAPVAEG